MKLRYAGIALLVLSALLIGLSMAACQSSGPVKTPQQVWIEAHPTHTGPNGECIEFDDEPCDADPYDLDDWFESYNKTPAVKKTSPRPMQTARQPAPKTTKRRQ